MSGAWTPTLDAFRAGAISPPIALARLALSGDPPDAVRLRGMAADEPALAELATLAAAQETRLTALARLAATGMDPAGDDLIAATATLFDRLAREAPEAGVAFYSLGDPALLAAATDELVGVVRGWASVEGRRVLDLGCGIGRASIALAPWAESVIGVDVSPGMVEQARARGEGVPNVEFATVDGRDLAGVADGSVDLVLAADSFPYLVRAGVVDGQMAEIARVLASGGDLLVFNWSYRGDPAADAAEAGRLAAAHGFELTRAGEHPFAIWDAAGFQLKRRA